MVNVFGVHNAQFKTIRASGGAVADHSQPLGADQRSNAGAQLCEGPPKSEAAVRRGASVAEHVEALPPAVTKAERAEERLGILMLREALNDPLIPNPPKWKAASAFAQAQRAQLAKERRERVKLYAEEGVLTVQQAAELERVVPTTIRQDCQLLGVRLRASLVKLSPYQGQISQRRDRLEEMAPTGMTRARAAEKLGVSEATVRRDLLMGRIVWKGNDNV